MNDEMHDYMRQRQRRKDADVSSDDDDDDDDDSGAAEGGIGGDRAKDDTEDACLDEIADEVMASLELSESDGN